ncbi:MAG: Clp protease N-terminal domain-containing protein [Thermoleophilia bacterium]
MKLPNPVREIRTINELLAGADAAARRMGDVAPGSEHLLLAALEMDDGTARRAFARAGADPDGFEAAVAAQHEAALRAIGVEPPALDPADVDAGPPKGVFTSTPAAQRAFQEAVKLSKQVKPSRLLGAHVVVAVAEEEQGTAARTLRGMGVDAAALAGAARAEAAASRG